MSLETTELKLRTTPTGGVDASHSPYYRRLLSAGYKGFLQGTIGGASLYGTFGLVIGGLIAAPLLAVPGIGVAALAIIPAAAGLGIVKGASTFGNIGSVAAINAESADLTEQRRYLLDRYYDLPEGPEGDKEAEAIKRELLRQHDTGRAPHLFHWKTVAVCAAIGAALVLGAIGIAAIAPGALGELGIIHGAELLGHIAAHGTLATGIGAAAGALTGATIGIDRYYIRKWFDHTEGVVHDSSHTESALRERGMQVERIKAAAKDDERTKFQLRDTQGLAPNASTPVTPTPVPPTPTTVASLDKSADKPASKVSEATLQSRLADIQKAMEVPAL